MPHGIDAYFDDLARNRRRLATCGMAVTAAALLLELLAMRPAIVKELNDPRRFGYEGEEQYVRRILLETEGPVDQPGSQAQRVIAVPLRRGGNGGHESDTQTRHPGQVPQPSRPGTGPGDDLLEAQTRMRALALRGPVIRSEDLVVEKLVRPEYPELARDAGIEGVVEMVARVDTTGAVSEVHIVGGTHEPILEQSATTAVLQCIYRPYQLHGATEAVWAYYRVTFHLY